MHVSIPMAQRRVARMLPRQLVWPYDCNRRCGEMVNVPTGPVVAEEMTRHLRQPYKMQIREQWS